MSKQLPFYLRQQPKLNNDPAEWLPGFETDSQAAQRYEARGRLMFTKNSMSQPNFYWCAEASPCDSAACPPCMREFRVWLVDAGITLFEESLGELSAASLVHYSWSRRPGDLNGFDLDRAKRQMARHLDRAGLGDLVAIGGFDFSYNQPADGSIPYWQPHAYVIFQGIEQEALKQALRPFYPTTAEIPRPVRTRSVTEPMEALSYAVKAMFWRRSSYWDGWSNTRSLPLLPRAKRELLAYLDQHRPVDQLFLKNVRRQGVSLAPTTPLARSGLKPDDPNRRTKVTGAQLVTEKKRLRAQIARQNPS